MGFFKTLFKIGFLIIILIIGLPICIYILNDFEDYSNNKSSGEQEYSYRTGVEGKTTIFHKQENIHPNNYWYITVELGFNETLYANVKPQSPVTTRWMSNWDFQRFVEGKSHEYYDLGPNGSNGWKRLEYDGIGTWYLVFINDTDHIKTVNVELKK